MKKFDRATKLEVYSVSSMAKFTGFIKNGLDSSVLINLIVVFDSEFKEFRKRGFAFPPNLFYYHEISYSEVIGVLINEFGFAKEEAKKSLQKLIATFNLEKIKWIKELDDPFEQSVARANADLVTANGNPRLEIGIPDKIIIAGFMRAKINFIHSGDNGFLKTCEKLKLNIVPTPKKDIDKENEIKRRLKKK